MVGIGFPVGDDQVHNGHTPRVSRTFLALNVLVFVYQYFVLGGAAATEFTYTRGTIPELIANGERVITLITSMFLHGGFEHIAGNMLYLRIFGDNIEATIGSRKFLIFYILGGVAASLVHVLFSLGSDIPAIGASGAISAILGAYLIMFPAARVKMIGTNGIGYASAKSFLFLWIGFQLLSGTGTLVGAGSGGVAYWAHIGGFFFGVVAGKYFNRTPSIEVR